MLRTYNEIYLAARNVLRSYNIEGYALEAKVLVAAAAGKSTSRLLRDMHLFTSPEVEAKVVEYLERRVKGEPVAYITGTWEFYGLPMKVTRDVLIPRMDTELLVDTAKEVLLGKMMDAKILDLCCGSGCISCAIAHEFPATKIIAADISNNALQICRDNVMANRLNSRVFCLQTDATAPPPLSMNGFDMIISNPPYIPTAEILTLDKSVKDYEHMWALDGGEDGLKFYRTIIAYWTRALRPGGYLLLEVGEGQAKEVCSMMMKAGYMNVRTKQDTLKTDRVVYGKLSTVTGKKDRKEDSTDG